MVLTLAVGEGSAVGSESTQDLRAKLNFPMNSSLRPEMSLSAILENGITTGAQAGSRGMTISVIAGWCRQDRKLLSRLLDG